MSTSTSSLLFTLFTFLSLILLLVPCHAAVQYGFTLHANVPYRPPFANRLLAGNEAHFNITLTGLALGAVPAKVAVSPLGAQLPGLYGDFLSTTTALTARFRSSAVTQAKANGDIPFFNFTAGEAAGQSTLYIVVSCPIGLESACVFTIAVTTHNRQQAWPGFLNFDKLPQGSVQYFDYSPHFYNISAYPIGNNVSAALAVDDIHITANVLRGRISIYVISTPLPGVILPNSTNAQWKVVDYSNEVLLVPVGTNQAERNARISQQFIIAVVADDAQTTPDKMVVYSLQVSYRSQLTAVNGAPEAIVGESCRFLSDSIPTPGQALAVGDWDQYCFYAPTAKCAMDVTLTTYGGEQDIYLWFNGSFDYANAVFDTESDNLHKVLGDPSFYAIIIYTPEVSGRYAPGRYNILFHTNCTTENLTFTTLSIEEQTQSIAAPDVGDIGSRTTFAALAAQFREFLQHAERVASEYKTRQRRGLQQFSGEGNAPQFILPQYGDDDVAPPSSVHVEVMEEDSPSPSPQSRQLMSYLDQDEWGVTLTSSYHAVQLVQGQAQFGQLFPTRVARYVYHPLSFNYDITIELNRRSGADPNLYVATSNFATLPFPHSAQWVSNFSGNDYITVDRMDIKKCATLGCFYHIAVFIDGDSPYTGFTLTVSEGEALTDLQSGQVYANRLVANEPDYLRFVATQPGQAITITLTDTGRTLPRAYISTLVRFPNVTNNQRPIIVGSDGNQESGFTSITTNGGQSLGCNPTRVRPCYYYIQVISSGNTTYSIVVSAGGSIELRNAIYQEGRVNQNAWSYYKFVVSPGFTRFAVSMLLITGQANMYVSRSEQYPNATSYVVMRDYLNLNTPITIYENNLAMTCAMGNSSFCTFTIGVFGVSLGQTTFALLATEGLRASVGVSNGLPIRQTMPVNGTYYWWTKVEANTRVQICVTVISGTVNGYLSEQMDNTYPGPGNFDVPLTIVEPGYRCLFDFDHPGGDIYWSLTNPSLVYGAQVSVMFLQQKGINDTTTEVQLSDGFPQAALLSGQRSITRNQQTITYPPNQLIYFNFLLSSLASTLVIDMYAISGDADVYVTYLPTINLQNLQLRYPTRQWSNWNSNLTGSDVIVLQNQLPGRYIVAVFHTATAATADVNFILTVSTPLFPQSLQDGLGVRGYVGNNLYKFYTIPVTARDAITIRLTPTQGNPDLYASIVPSFTSATAIWRSAALTGTDVITIPSNDVRRPSNGSWTLYIAVHSPGAVSQFTMVTTLTASSMFIQPNVPILGTVATGSYDYYMYRPDSLNYYFDIFITRFDGNPQLFVSWTENPTSTPGTYNGTTYSVGASLSFRVTPILSPRGLSCLSRNITDLLDCVYYIGITNFNVTNSSPQLIYSLQVGQQSGVTTLFDRISIAGQVLARELHQYQYQNSVLNTRTVVIAVTATVGDVDIYVATTPNAGPTNFVRSSTGSGDDVIVIQNAANPYYYIGVQNKLNSTSQYTLSGRAYVPGQVGVNAVTLGADQSYNDFCGRGDYSYYYFTPSGTWPELTVSVNARIGDPNIYVNSLLLDGSLAWPNTSHSRWRSVGVGSDYLTIVDPPVGSTLYIAVHAVTDAFYTITISGEGRTILMSAGLPYTGELQATKSQFYQLNLQSLVAVDQLVFSLTSRVGNADLYISDTYPNPSPSVARSFNWSSTELAGAVDIFSLRNVTNPLSGRPDLHIGTYYVAVYATGAVGTSASYLLFASAGQRTTLIDGRPIAYSLQSGGSVFFEAIYGAGASWSVHTVSTSVTTIPLWVLVSLQENIVVGRPSTYQWSSITNSSSIDLTIPGTSCTTMTCRYTILVHLPDSTPLVGITFNIGTQTAGTITALTAGVPQGGIVASAAYHYYSFALNCPSNVSLFLTATSGNPDLFVNQGPLPPTRATAAFFSNSVGLASDYVSFSPSSDYFRLNASRSMVGRYYVSVFGAQLNSAYSLVLVIDNQCGTADTGGNGGNGTTVTYISLVNGQPQYGRVGLEAWLYYRFLVTPAMWPTSVTFALSPTDGSDPDMFITKDGTLPTPENFAWQSVWSLGTDDIIYISPNATTPPPCIPTVSSCTYLVGIYGWTASSYTLTASTAGTILGLQMDYSREGGVNVGQWTYYTLRVDDSSQPLVIIVSPNTGNPDLYVEFGAQPTLQSLTSKTFGVDVITIPEPSVGDWRIGVYGVGPGFSTYSIVASQRGISLRNGHPQDDVLTAGQSRYYFFEFNEPSGTRPFRLQIDPISFNPMLEVYVRRDQAPSPTQSAFNLSTARGDVLSLLVPYGNPQWRATAQWRVLVISRSATAAYSITAAQGHPPIYVSDGRATDVGELVPLGEYRYFRMLVLSNAYPLTITVTLQVGSAALFVSTTDPLPSHDTAFRWNASAAGAGAVITLTVPQNSLPSYVYAGIRTMGVGTARYTVTFSTGLTLVQAGVFSSASCTPGSGLTAFILYPPFNRSYIDDVTMRVSNPSPVNYSRPLAIYVTANSSSARASSTANDWSFTLLDWASPFTISRNDPKLQSCVDRDNCELRISVGCQGVVTSPLTYQFSVQIGASYIPLATGQSAVGTALATNQDRYYSISTGTAGNVTGNFFQIRADPCTGNVGLFVNYRRGGIPTSNNNDESSTETGRVQSVSINAPVTTGRVIATIRGMTVKPSTYQLSTWTDRSFDYFAPSTVNGTLTIWQVSPMAVAEKTIAIYFLAARTPQAVTEQVLRPAQGQVGYMRYTVYWAYEPSEAVMYTMCGLNLTNVALVAYSLAGTNVTVKFTVPSDVMRYTINVVAQYIWRTTTTRVETPASPAYLAYRALHSVLPGQGSIVNPTGPWPEDSSSSSAVYKPPHPSTGDADTTPTLDTVVLAFAIGVPLTVAICAVLFFLHVRNQRILENGGIELNEGFNTGGSSSDGTSSTRPHDKFNRLVEEQHDTGAYVPPGSQGGYAPPGSQFARGGMDSNSHHEETNGNSGGGDYGGMSSQQVIQNGNAGGWSQGSAMSHYAQQASGQEHEHISGRGFYEL